MRSSGLDPADALGGIHPAAAGDEIYAAIEIAGVVHTGFSPDWTPDEATTPIVEQLREANR